MHCRTRILALALLALVAAFSSGCYYTVGYHHVHHKHKHWGHKGHHGHHGGHWAHHGGHSGHDWHHRRR